MKLCKVCGKSYRSGRIAYIMSDKGLKGARVCQGCATGGVLVVAASEAARCKCGQPATKCHACAGTKSGDVVAAIKVLEGRLKVTKSTRYVLDPAGDAATEGRIEGLESAIELLKSGRF